MDGYVVIGTELDTKKFDAQIKEVEYELKQLDYELSHAKELKLDSRTIEEYKSKAEKLSNKLVELRKKQEDLNRTDLSGARSSMDGIGNSIEKIIHKISRWGLAIFGVRSAYMFVRQTMSALTGYNEQIGADVEYIRFALATALQPVIEKIIQLAYKLLAYTAYIAKAWFGVNIFANATADAFQKANSNVKATNKSAKELQKTLTGFDEMNILQKDGSVAAGGGGGGIALPSTDLSDLQNIEIPDWVKWIANNKDKILDWVKLLAIAFGAIKIAQFLTSLGQAGEGIFNFGKKIADSIKQMDLWKTVGIAAIITGCILAIKNIWDLMNNWDDLDEKQKMIKIALVVLGDAFIAFGYAIKKGIDIGTLGMGTLIALVVDLIAVIGNFIWKLFSEEKAIKSVEDATKSLKEAQDNLRRTTDAYIEAVDREDEAMKNLKQAEEDTGLSGKKLYKAVQDGTMDYKTMNAEQRRVYKAYIDLINAQTDVKNSKKELKTATKEEKEETWDTILAKNKEADTLENFKNVVIEAWHTQELKTKEAQKLLSQAMTEMDRDTEKTFKENIPKTLRDGLNPEKYRTTWQSLKRDFSNAWDDLVGIFKGTWNKFKSWFSLNSNFSANVSVKASSSKQGYAKGGIIHHSLPKLAPGGIINQPGRGVPLGSAIGGERGAEGVIPLTDSQQMALLGEAIGKYIVVNANITNTMNGRVISRELQKINNESDFAFNR